MEPEDIVTERDFFVCIQQLANKAQAYQGTLADYLSGILRLVSDHERDAPTGRLIARILTDGLIADPLPFDPSWLECVNPPAALVEDNWNGVDQFETVRNMLRFQIADLHRMDASGDLQSAHRVLGLVSPTGHSWYNFDPAAFLDCAIGPFYRGNDLDPRLDDEEPVDDVEAWAMLVWLLRAGQEYE